MKTKLRNIFIFLILVALAALAIFNLRPPAPRTGVEESFKISKERFEKEGFNLEMYEIITTEGTGYWEFTLRRKDGARHPGDHHFVRVDKYTSAVMFQAGL